MASTEEHEGRAERMKLMYDLNKHLTTLSTGSLLLMSGLFSQVFKTPIWKPVAAASFALFAACVVASVFAMFGFAMYSADTFKTAEDPVDFGGGAFLFAIALFILAVAAFAVFALKNIY